MKYEKTRTTQPVNILLDPLKTLHQLAHPLSNLAEQLQKQPSMTSCPAVTFRRTICKITQE